MTDKLRELALLALESHGCERLKDFYKCGPVQRAAVETFLEAALAQQDAQSVVTLPSRVREAAYDQIDRFLRNNLHYDDYVDYSAALDSLHAAPMPPAQHREPDYTICPTCGGMASDPIVPQEQISDGEFDADKRLMELADKIDHEQNWRLFPPKRLGAGITSFRASTLEKAVEMAMKYQGLNAAPTPTAQQDAQAVPYEPDDIGVQQDKRVFARIEAMKKRTAPQPAKRVMLTPEEITEVIVDCYGYSADIEFHECLARAVIEAYERKNGIK